MNTKSSSIRIIVIDRCLRSKTRHTLVDIMKAVNSELEARNEIPVSSRHTILDDMSFITAQWHVVIKSEKVGRYVYYSYENTDFSIYNVALSEDEIINLTGTLVMLKRFQGLPSFEWLQNLVERCEENFKSSTPEPHYISLEENPYLSGLHNLTPLYDAIVHHKVLDIWYHSFKYPTAQKNTVHPYFLKQFNNRWFLFCYNDHRKEISNYPIDRIEKIEPNDKHYIENTFFDFEEFFDDIVGVSREKDDQVETVKIWISAKQWPYTQTKPLHATQKVIEKREDGSVVVEIKVIINWELEQTIMSQGEHMAVLNPDHLREKMKSRLATAMSLYQ